MPPLDFPANPVDGQVYETFVYDATVGVWRSQASGGGFPITVANGGTGATTVAGAQDSLRVGLVPMSPTSVAKVGGSASANTYGQVEFSSVQSISLNSVFTSNYRKYFVALSVSGTADATLYLRFRASNSDSVVASYFQGGRFENSNGASGIFSVNADSAHSILKLHNGAEVQSSSAVIHNPQTVQATTSQFHSTGYSTANGVGLYAMSAMHNVSASYDGFTFSTPSGTISGRVQVFGYRD